MKRMQGMKIARSFGAFLFYLSLGVFSVRAEESLSSELQEPPILNVYHWFQMIPADVLRDFEKETGIRVNLDIYDSNDVLEARLLAGKTGYDVVGPSAFPYLARQVVAGLYLPLDKEKLPNLAGVSPDILEKLSKSDPENRHALPLLWGLVALGINYQRLPKDLADEIQAQEEKSWALLLDPQYVSRFASCGVTLLEEAADVFLPVYLYLGLSPQSHSRQDLAKVTEALTKVRPFISRLDAVKSADDLAMGDACLVMHWAGDLERSKATLAARQNMDHVEIFIPKEGTVMWIDCMAIPVDAPHPDNAHRFLNFLMRPDIMARLTNETRFANPVPASLPQVEKSIRLNPSLFPSPENRERIYVNEPVPPSLARHINRAMMKVRTGR